MADFTTTTNLNLKKPAVGGSSDKWGEYLNSDLDTIDTEIQSLKTASTSRSLESLSNVLDTTPTTGQLLQYGTASWRAATVTIPDDIEDLTNVTVTSPSDGEVLAWSASNARWENQSAGVATIPAGSITTAKLSTSLQGQINLILQTTGTPTDDQILRYNASTTNWEFQDLPGGTISALSDTDVSGISNQDVLVYNSTSGDWVSRPLAIADVTGLQAQLDAKLESSDLSVSSLTDTTITTTADNSVLVYDASDSKWKNEGPSAARSSLGLAIGTDVQAYDADTTKNDVTNTFSANQIISVADNTNAALRITQTGTGNALVVEDDTNPDSTPFVVDASGFVKIGTTSNLSPSGLAEAPFQIAYVGSTTPLAVFRQGTNTTQGAEIILEHARNSSQNATVNNGDNLGEIRIFGADGTEMIEAASIAAQVDGTPGTNDMPGRLVFSTTADNASSPTERMRIDSSGNVGIGTSSPSAKLDVQGALYSGVSGTTSQEQIQFNCQSTYAGQIYTNNLENLWLLAGSKYDGSNHVVNTGTTAASIKIIAGKIRFETDSGLTASSSFTPTERMRIDSSGNVGIGTTSPAQKLDVTGNINATGALTLGTALAVAEGGTGVTALSSLDAANLGSGSATDGYVLTADGAGGAAWEAASGGGGGTTAYLEHSSTISDSFTIASGTNRMYIGGTTFSGTITVAGRLAIVAGPANFTGTINITGTLATV